MADPNRPSVDEIRTKYGGRPGKMVGTRLSDGDLETLEWLSDQLGMSKANVVRRAIAAYAAQIMNMRRR